MNPVAFLQRKQNGVLPSNVDARLLEELTNQYKLKDDVINIMIEHILNTNQNRLDRNYVTKVASTWVRNQVDTQEKAFEACKPIEKKTKTIKQIDRKLPDWYTNKDEEEFEEVSVEKMAEFEKMLEELE